MNIPLDLLTWLVFFVLSWYFMLILESTVHVMSMMLLRLGSLCCEGSYEVIDVALFTVLLVLCYRDKPNSIFLYNIFNRCNPNRATTGKWEKAELNYRLALSWRRRNREIFEPQKGSVGTKERKVLSMIEMHYSSFFFAHIITVNVESFKYLSIGLITWIYWRTTFVLCVPSLRPKS